MATLFVATWHREGGRKFSCFLNENHIHIWPLGGIKYAVLKRRQILPDCTVPNLENKNTQKT